MPDDAKPNAAEGSALFVLKTGMVYNDDRRSSILDLKMDDGSVEVIKDADNSVKVYHKSAEGRMTMLARDVSSLSSERGHMFAVIWSLAGRRLALYVDDDSAIETPLLDRCADGGTRGRETHPG